MPLYTVSTLAPVAEHQRQPLAAIIMDVHCSLTGAPETFVNVIFSHGVPLEQADCHILATVRKGRTADMSARLSAILSERICEYLHLQPYQLDIDMYEMPAAWVMEGGNVLPEPGEEDQCEWLNEHKSQG